MLLSSQTRPLYTSIETNNKKTGIIEQKMDELIIYLDKVTIIDLEISKYADLGMIDIRNFVVDSEGCIYFYQQRSHKNFIFKFDKFGNFITAFGRKGQGPGEFQMISVLNFNNKNELLVNDILRKKCIFFNKKGDYLREVSLPKSVDLVFPLENGNFLTWESLYISEDIEKQMTVLILYSQKNEKIKELLRIETPIPQTAKKIVGIRNPNIFCYKDNSIYIGFGEKGYIISKYNLDGELKQQIIKKKYNKVKISESYKSKYLDRFRGPEGDKIKKKVFFPKHFPPFQYMFSDDKDRLYVMTYEKKKNSDEYLYDVFDSDGLFKGIFWLDNIGHHGVVKTEYPLTVIVQGGLLYCLKEKQSTFKKLEIYRIIWKN